MQAARKYAGEEALDPCTGRVRPVSRSRNETRPGTRGEHCPVDGPFPALLSLARRGEVGALGKRGVLGYEPTAVESGAILQIAGRPAGLGCDVEPNSHRSGIGSLPSARFRTRDLVGRAAPLGARLWRASPESRNGSPLAVSSRSCVVEVAGIEPASFGPFAWLLRVQLVVNFLQRVTASA